MKQGFQGPSGQIQLFFGNKADVALGRLICAVPPQPVFAFQLGPVPPYIEPKKQVRLIRSSSSGPKCRHAMAPQPVRYQQRAAAVVASHAS